MHSMYSDHMLTLTHVALPITRSMISICFASTFLQCILEQVLTSNDKDQTSQATLTTEKDFISIL